MKKVIIIGGGAAGMFAAIHLKRQLKDEVEVKILELQNRIGKKLLVTGNGKCNISNEWITPDHYNSWTVKPALEKFPPALFKKVAYDMGLMLRSDEAGRMYPYSEKASNVLDIFRNELDKLGVEVICDIHVNHIKTGKEFLVYSKDYRLYRSDYVIVATGGSSGITFENTSYEMLRYLGHTVTELKPGLVAIKTKENVKSLAGLRVKAKVSVIDQNEVTYETVGEVLFKDTGLSGIAIFEASRYVNKDPQISLDLAYDKTKEELEAFLSKTSVEEALLGLFPKMVGQDLLRRGEGVIQTMKDYRFTGLELLDFSLAQVTRGGVSTKEVNPYTYESFVVPGLYVVGEVLDVDGASGGFNLHFAWASSMLAVEDIVNKTKKEDDWL